MWSQVWSQSCAGSLAGRFDFWTSKIWGLTLFIHNGMPKDCWVEKSWPCKGYQAKRIYHISKENILYFVYSYIYTVHLIIRWSWFLHLFASFFLFGWYLYFFLGVGGFSTVMSFHGPRKLFHKYCEHDPTFKALCRFAVCSLEIQQVQLLGKMMSLQLADKSAFLFKMGSTKYLHCENWNAEVMYVHSSKQPSFHVFFWNQKHVANGAPAGGRTPSEKPCRTRSPNWILFDLFVSPKE